MRVISHNTLQYTPKICWHCCWILSHIIYLYDLKLKYKRRVYKTLHLDEKQLKALHTRTNYRRLLDYVTNSQVEKISKMCNKGLDPNFHCQETGGKILSIIVYSVATDGTRWFQTRVKLAVRVDITRSLKLSFIPCHALYFVYYLHWYWWF